MTGFDSTLRFHEAVTANLSRQLNTVISTFENTNRHPTISGEFHLVGNYSLLAHANTFFLSWHTTGRSTVSSVQSLQTMMRMMIENYAAIEAQLTQAVSSLGES